VSARVHLLFGTVIAESIWAENNGTAPLRVIPSTQHSRGGRRRCLHRGGSPGGERAPASGAEGLRDPLDRCAHGGVRRLGAPIERQQASPECAAVAPTRASWIRLPRSRASATAVSIRLNARGGRDSGSPGNTPRPTSTATSGDTARPCGSRVSTTENDVDGEPAHRSRGGGTALCLVPFGHRWRDDAGVCGDRNRHRRVPSTKERTSATVSGGTSPAARRTGRGPESSMATGRSARRISN